MFKTYMKWLTIDLCIRCARISRILDRGTEAGEAVVMQSVTEAAWFPAAEYKRPIGCAD